MTLAGPVTHEGPLCRAGGRLRFVLDDPSHLGRWELVPSPMIRDTLCVLIAPVRVVQEPTGLPVARVDALLPDCGSRADATRLALAALHGDIPLSACSSRGR
jgi:hypothetical protein